MHSVKKIKILIIGSTGMLGNTLTEYFLSINYSVKTLDRDGLDLSNHKYEELEEKINKSKCDLVINCAGLIKQRNKTTSADFIAVNSLFPHRLANICEKNKKRLIHFTTDCVFNGKNGNYTEEDVHNVFDDYGRSKSMGEPYNCTVIRTSIIGEEEKNKLSLLEWIKSNKGKKINGYKNHIWNGVTCLQLGKIINEIIVENKFWQGVRHVFSDSVTKYDLLNMINEAYELNIYITPVDDKYSTNRTLYTNFTDDIIKVPSLNKQIIETRDFHIKVRSNGKYG